MSVGQSSMVPVRATSLPVQGLDGKESKRTGYVFSTVMMMHTDDEKDDPHPDQPARIYRIMSLLKTAGLIERMKQLTIRQATKEEVTLIHSPEHWDKVQAITGMDDAALLNAKAFYESLSLYVNNSTPLCARLSCGGVIEAALAVGRGEVRNSFAIVRPPGHHAEPEEHMGFCFFNNVSVATRVAQRELNIRKILILDWDVHHGNGTQRAFYDDPDVLYISLHRYEGGMFYPGGTFGGMDKCGEGLGVGKTVNIPWPTAGMGDADYIHAFQKIVMPIAYEFAPELVIISAGFDAADGDKLGECKVSPACYAHMTYMLSVLAHGKLVVALEGGYNIDALSQSALAVTATLLGEAPPDIGPMTASEVATETVWQVAHYQSRYWKNIDPRACEPREDVGEEETFTIPELLKAHRAHFMAKEYGMLFIPFANGVLEEAFGGQLLCTPDLYKDEKETLVVFLHDLGNLRIELESALKCDVNLEHSYLIDVSRMIVDWVLKENWSLIDMNLLPRPLRKYSTLSWTEFKDIEKQYDDIIKQLVTYVWDNYIELSEAENVVLIGHGSACRAITTLLNNRACTKKVKFVVQVNGLYTVPAVSKGDAELKKWYHHHSLVYLPADHEVCKSAIELGKSHGNLIRLKETKAVKVLQAALPHFKKRLSEQLNPAPPHMTNGVLNGASSSGDVDMG